MNSWATGRESLRIGEGAGRGERGSEERASAAQRGKRRPPPPPQRKPTSRPTSNLHISHLFLIFLPHLSLPRPTRTGSLPTWPTTAWAAVAAVVTVLIVVVPPTTAAGAGLGPGLARGRPPGGGRARGHAPRPGIAPARRREEGSAGVAVASGGTPTGTPAGTPTARLPPPLNPNHRPAFLPAWAGGSSRPPPHPLTPPSTASWRPWRRSWHL